MQWPPRPGPGLELHEAERLAAGRLDDLPDVDAEPVAEHGELVDQGDVDAAEDVFEQLGHFGHLGGGDRHEVIERLAVDLDDLGGAGRREAAHDLGRRLGRVVGAPGIDPLGREGEVEVGARGEPRALFEERREHLAGRARVRGALEADELAAPHMAGQLDRRVLDERQVGLAIGVQRRRQADDAGRAVLGGRVVGGGRKQALVDDRHQRLVGDVDDVRGAGLDGAATIGVGLDTDDLDARLGEGHCEGQADVAHADDCDLHFCAPVRGVGRVAGRRGDRATDCIASARSDRSRSRRSAA